MCGIAGYLLREPEASPGQIAQIFLASLRHRGPDESGTALEGSVGLVNTRLSIIDLACGKQPFHSDNGEISLIQNGEIYNFVELREELRSCGHVFRTNSDTEVLLRAYEEYGEDFPRHCNGMFAVAILDRTRRKIVLARDRLGVKPLFLYRAAEGIYFSSELKSFLSLPQFSSAIDPQALSLYLVYNYVPLPRTIFRDVSHLGPGTVLSVDLDTLKERSSTYWSIPNERERGDLTVDEVLGDLDAIFQDAVRIRLRSDVPIGVFLSSGLDSSLVSAALQRAEPGMRDAYSVRVGDPHHDESVMAADTARSLGWRAHPVDVDLQELSLWPQVLFSADQPHGDISFIALSKLSERAAKDLKVVYTGDGGDEVFAGYDRYLRLLESGASKSQPLDEYFRQESVIDEGDMLRRIAAPELLASSVPDAAYRLFQSTMGEVSEKDVINRVLYTDMRQLLPGTNLVKVDRMTMAHSLEARSPFLDYRLYEYLFRVPGALKLAGGQIRSLQRLLAERYLSKETIYRPKRMLAIPIGDWFRGRWKDQLVNFFECEFSWDRGYFQPKAVKQLVQDHISGAAEHRRAIRALIALELWFRNIEGQPAPPAFGGSRAL